MSRIEHGGRCLEELRKVAGDCTRAELPLSKKDPMAVAEHKLAVGIFYNLLLYTVSSICTRTNPLLIRKSAESKGSNGWLAWSRQGTFHRSQAHHEHVESEK